MPCKLSVAFPELVEGKVHAAVVDQVPGDGQRVSLGNAVPQQAFTEDYHDALPVTARYLQREQGAHVKLQSKSCEGVIKANEDERNVQCESLLHVKRESDLHHK